jgi:hypothetical protein
VSLVTINILILLTRRQGVFAWAAALVGAGAMLATPWIWARDFVGRIPLGLALYLNPHGVSLFPLFPWITFVMAGACAAYLFLNAASKREDPSFMRNALFVSLVVILGCLVARDLPLSDYWRAGFYRTSPLYVMIRLGCVVILCAGLYAMEKRFGWMPRNIRLAGQESLLVYTLHLLLIFSILRGKMLSPILVREAGYFQCFLMSAAIIVLMLWLARIWNRLKRNHPRAARAVLASFAGINVLLFLLK